MNKHVIVFSEDPEKTMKSCLTTIHDPLQVHPDLFPKSNGFIINFEKDTGFHELIDDNFEHLLNEGQSQFTMHQCYSYNLIGMYLSRYFDPIVDKFVKVVDNLLETHPNVGTEDIQRHADYKSEFQPILDVLDRDRELGRIRCMYSKDHTFSEILASHYWDNTIVITDERVFELRNRGVLANYTISVFEMPSRDSQARNILSKVYSSIPRTTPIHVYKASF